MTKENKNMEKENKIKKINIDLFPPASVSKSIYEEKKATYIADFKEYNHGGIFSTGSYQHNPELAEAKWNKMYPNGYEDWANGVLRLNARGEQNLVDKINEIIDILNKKKI